MRRALFLSAAALGAVGCVRGEGGASNPRPSADDAAPGDDVDAGPVDASRPEVDVDAGADAGVDGGGLAFEPFELVDPLDIGFGRVRVGSEVSILARFTHDGEAPREFSARLASGNGCRPFCSETTPSVVQPGDTYDVLLWARPTSLDDPTRDVLHVESRDLDGRLESARARVVDLEPTSEVPVDCRVPPDLEVGGATSGPPSPCPADAEAQFAIECSTRGASRIAFAAVVSDQVGIEPVFEGPVEVTAPEPLRLPVRVCRPPGPFEAELALVEQGSGDDVSIPVRGLVRGARLSAPEGVDFGVTIASSFFDVEREVELRSVGAAPLRDVTARIEGPDADDFTIFGPPPNGFTEFPVGVRFRPRSSGPGPRSADLVIESNDDRGQPIRVRLWGTVADDSGCRFEAPDTIDLGAASPRGFTFPLIVRNTGTTRCVAQVSGVQRLDVASTVAPPPSPFRFESFVLAPTAERRFELTTAFAPTDIPGARAQLVFRVGSAAQHRIDVAVDPVGDTLRPVGVPRDRCGTERGFELEVLRFSDGPIQGPPSEVRLVDADGLANLTWTHRDPQPRELVVRFELTAESEGRGTIEITVPGWPIGTESTVRIPVAVTARDGLQIDRFDGPYAPETDLLVILDDSPSFGDSGPATADNLTRLFGGDGFEGYLGQSPRVRLFFTTPGRLRRGELLARDDEVGGYDWLLDQPADVDPLEASRPARELADSGRGSGWEAPLEALERGLPILPEGTLRSDAQLSVLIVTDEDDWSPTDLEATWGRVRPYPWRDALAVVCGGPSGCRTDAHRAGPAPRLFELLPETSSFGASTCDPDWWRAVDAIVPPELWNRARDFLTNQPLPSTLRVYVDDVEVPREGPDGTNWRYEFSTNSIEFTPRVGRPRSAWRAEYRAECPPEPGP